GGTNPGGALNGVVSTVTGALGGNNPTGALNGVVNTATNAVNTIVAAHGALDQAVIDLASNGLNGAVGTVTGA
ncbi:hypothetical protein DN520_31045, partial [Burkholderia multivorans]